MQCPPSIHDSFIYEFHYIYLYTISHHPLHHIHIHTACINISLHPYTMHVNTYVTNVSIFSVGSTQKVCQFSYTPTTWNLTCYFPLTCHGFSQSSGIGMAPNHAPITAPCPGTLTASSTPPSALRSNTQSPKQHLLIITNL